MTSIAAFTFDLQNPFVAGLIAAAALVTAWQVIWKRLIVKVYGAVKYTERAREAAPTLFSIAEEFKQNGGNSMRDAVDSKADKDDVERLEKGLLEVIKIGRENQERLLWSTENLNEHLKQISWAQERAQVLADLELVKRTQQGLIGGVAAALSGDGDMEQVRARVIAALERSAPEVGADDDRDR